MISLLILAVAQMTSADVPKASTFMSDAELDALVTEARTKHSASGSDPLWLVRMANKLMPLGAPKALSVIEELKSRRVSIGDTISGDDLHWLTSMLIDLPDRTNAPLPGIGVQIKRAPAPGTLATRWPLAIVDDVPLVGPYTIVLEGTGKPESTTDYAMRLLKIGKWRTRPFKPRQDPFGAFDTIARSSAFRSADVDALSDTMSSQLLRFVRTAYRPHSVPRYRMTGRQAIEFFRGEFAAVRAKWDPKLDLYVRLDGTHDPY